MFQDSDRTIGRIWSSASGMLAAVARQGDSAPGFPAGTTFSSDFGPRASNAAGQAAFTAQLAGPGISASNDDSLWVSNVDGTI